MELSNQMKVLLKDLGMALHKALTKDSEIKAITDQIKGSGYDIYLIMEANIALDKRENENEEGQIYYHTPEDQEEMDAATFNQYDRDFLASMKIKFADGE